ncbi:MAG TPA: hypothetical protein VM182_02530, partial [Terriglobia bacterium]|nr:hypothetical protein [Terriglobia bacterium]
TRAARAMLGTPTPFCVAAPAPSPSAGSQKPSHVPQSGAESPTLEPEELVAEVRSILWEKVGIIRQGKGLREAVTELKSLDLALPAEPLRPDYEARNILEVARLIAASALAREESRGGHYREDFPLKNDTAPPQHSFVARESPVFFARVAASGVGVASPRA